MNNLRTPASLENSELTTLIMHTLPLVNHLRAVNLDASNRYIEFTWLDASFGVCSDLTAKELTVDGEKRTTPASVLLTELLIAQHETQSNIPQK